MLGVGGDGDVAYACVAYTPCGREGVVVVVEGVGDGADVVAAEDFADFAGLAVVVEGAVFAGEDGDGEVVEIGVGGHHDIELAAGRGDLLRRVEMQHHAAVAVGECFEHRLTVAGACQLCFATEHLVVDTFHLNGAYQDGAGGFEGDLEQGSEVAELQLVAARGTIGGHGVVDKLAPLVVDIVFLHIGESDGGALNAAGGVEGGDVARDAADVDGGLVAMPRGSDCDGAFRGAVDFHMVAVAPAGVVFVVDVGLVVVFILLDSGGENAPFILLARGRHKCDNRRNC